MKRLFALTLICLLPFALKTSAGPEQYEAKSVVQPIAAPMCDWTGFYIGVHGGWRGGSNEWQRTTDAVDTPGDLALRETIHGGFGGLEFGYNRQFGQWFVIGLELTGAYGTPDQNTTVVESGDSDIKHFGTQNDWGGTFALRIGFTSFNNKLFMYGKVGGAVTHWNYDYINDETLSNSLHQSELDRWHEEETRISPLVGAGLEYAVTCHWTIKAEWNRTFLGEQTVSGVLHEDPSPDFIDSNDPNHAYNIRLEQDSAFVGLNYKF
jgi:outer membrane immunogenic protein